MNKPALSAMLFLILFWVAMFVLVGCKSDFIYMPDKADTWQTPSETAKRGGGDCEDWAIREYYRGNASFIALGTRDGKSHAWVIDSSGRIVDLLPTKAAYIERIRFNEAMFITEMGKVGNARKIKKWADVMDRKRDE